LIWINSFFRRLCCRRRSLLADYRHDDVSQHRQAKAVRNDAAELTEKFERRRVRAGFVPITHVPLNLCGQPSIRAELSFVHGSLHATTQDARRALTDADTVKLSGTRI